MACDGNWLLHARCSAGIAWSYIVGDAGCRAGFAGHTACDSGQKALKLPFSVRLSSLVHRFRLRFGSVFRQRFQNDTAMRFGDLNLIALESELLRQANILINPVTH